MGLSASSSSESVPVGFRKKKKKNYAPHTVTRRPTWITLNSGLTKILSSWLFEALYLWTRASTWILNRYRYRYARAFDALGFRKIVASCHGLPKFPFHWFQSRPSLPKGYGAAISETLTWGGVWGAVNWIFSYSIFMGKLLQNNISWNKFREGESI